METRGRRRAAKLVLLVLVPSAVALLVGGGLLLAERAGLVALRRAPSVVLLRWTEDEETRHGIAIINTDVTPGSFLLGLDDDRSFRVWVPGRSIVVRTYVPAYMG